MSDLEASRPHGRGQVIAVCLLAAILTAARCAIYLREDVDFDGDQAVIGLMAKHFAEGRAVALYQYAFDYVLVLNAWLAAPAVRAFGATVASVRLPELAFNVVAVVLLVLTLVRETRLPPWTALVAAMPLVAPTPVVAGNLMSVLGGNVEPIVYVLLLWAMRERAVAFGLVAALGILTREFTAYGVAALLVVDLLDRRLFTRARLQFYAIAAACGAVLVDVVRVLRPHMDRFGPGTSGLGGLDQSAVGVLASALCFSPRVALENLATLFGPFLTQFTGAARLPLDGYGDGTFAQGVPGAWPLLAITGLLVAGRLAWHARRPAAALSGWPRFPLYLVGVGLQSFLVYALTRCGALSFYTVRYGLLGILLLVGIVALLLAVETRRAWRAAVLAGCVALASIAVVDHSRLVAYYATHRAPGGYRVLVDELTRQGVRFISSDYLTVAQVAFLSQERIVGTSTTFIGRVTEYERLAAAHADEVTIVSREPCDGGRRVAVWFVCDGRVDAHR